MAGFGIGLLFAVAWISGRPAGPLIVASSTLLLICMVIARKQLRRRFYLDSKVLPPERKAEFLALNEGSCPTSKPFERADLHDGEELEELIVEPGRVV